VAYILICQEADLNAAELLEQVRTRIDSDQKPRQAGFVPDLPRLPQRAVEEEAIQGNADPSWMTRCSVVHCRGVAALEGGFL